MRTASCACGRLSADCRGEPASVSLCCCAQCQRRTGGAFGVAVFFPRQAVTVRGEAAAYTRPSDSGQPVTFHFCPACGSSVYWEPHRKPDMVAVALGAFADPGFPRPGKAVYAERRPSWLAVETG